jgi:peptidoglycan/xylan/chitin deacetylase (PgdA/CDA1 family)
MYHYVRPGPDRPPYEYYHLALEDFRRQLDHLQAEYTLVDRGTFVAATEGTGTLPDDAVVLTFDDGLVDHYDHVLPELQARGLWGLFFVPGPVGDTPLSVHRVHALLGTVGAAAVDEALEQLVDPTDVRAGRSEEFQRMYAETDSDAVTTRVKRTLNYFLPYGRVPEVLDALEERFPAAQFEPEELYMDDEEVAALADAGMLVGGHTVTHRVLSRLSPDDQRRELERSLAHVEESAGSQPLRTFAYPYGDPETFDDTTLAVLRQAGCDIAFTTHPEDVPPDRFRTTPLQLPRRDCNEFPHGASSRS